MAKIIIQDLDQDIELDRKAMTAITGGFNPQPEPPRLSSFTSKRRNDRARRGRGGLSSLSRGRGTNIGNTINAKGIIIING